MDDLATNSPVRRPSDAIPTMRRPSSFPKRGFHSRESPLGLPKTGLGSGTQASSTPRPPASRVGRAPSGQRNLSHPPDSCKAPPKNPVIFPPSQPRQPRFHPASAPDPAGIAAWTGRLGTPTVRKGPQLPTSSGVPAGAKRSYELPPLKKAWGEGSSSRVLVFRAAPAFRPGGHIPVKPVHVSGGSRVRVRPGRTIRVFPPERYGPRRRLERKKEESRA